MEKIELTNEERELILDKINKEKEEISSKVMPLMEKIFGEKIKYENYRK